MDIYFVDEDAGSRNAVKAAVSLAKARYDAKYAKFVRGSQARLSFIEDELTAIAQDCAYQTDADASKVEAHLRRIIAEELAPVGDPEGSQLENSDDVPHIEGETTTVDIKGDETVGDIENQDERVDLNSETGKFGSVVRAYATAEIGNAGDDSTWQKCFRCSLPLNPVVASVTPVCMTCTKDLLKMAYGGDDEAFDDAATPPEIHNDDTPAVENAVIGDPPVHSTKALEIVSLHDGRVVETIPLDKDDPDYIARVTLGLYTDMDRDRFFIREVELPTPKGLDIGEDQEEGEIVPLVEPVPPAKTPAPEPTPVREKEKVTKKESIRFLDPNTQVGCELCSFQGTPAQVQLHEQQAHPELAQRAQQQQQMNATPNIAPAALPGQTAFSGVGLDTALTGAGVAAALVGLLSRRFGIHIPESDAEALLNEAMGKAPDGSQFKEEDAPRSASLFKVVAQFDSLAEYEEWELTAGRGD